MPSHAIGYAEDSRSQLKNKQSAFIRMSETKEFKAWHRLEVAKRLGWISDTVDKIERELKNPRLTKVETKDEQGRWRNENQSRRHRI
jgi:hypothetical protein